MHTVWSLLMKLSIDMPGLPQYEIKVEWCSRGQVIYPDIVKCAAFAYMFNEMQDEVYHEVHFCAHCLGWHTQHPNNGVRMKSDFELWDVECRDF